MPPDWTIRAQIQARLIALSHTPGSGFVGVWCDDGVLRLQREGWHSHAQLELLTWEDAETLTGLGRRPAQSVMITVLPITKTA